MHLRHVASCSILILLPLSQLPSSGQTGPSAIPLPGLLVIPSHLWTLLFGLLEKMSFIWSHLLYQRVEATKIPGVWIREIKDSAERDLENVNSLKQPFSGPPFIDSNESCMSDYRNENIFSKRRLLQGHYLVNSNRNICLLYSKKRIC